MTEASKMRHRQWLFPRPFTSRKHRDMCHLFRGNRVPMETRDERQGPRIGQRTGGVMKPFSPRFRRVPWLGGAAAAAAALVVAGVISSVAAQPTSLAGTSARGPGYPPPKGIYQSFTNCPLNNPVMHEVMPITDNGGGFAACIAGNATTGSITIGNITTPVVQPVNVQFGFFIPPRDANFYPAPAVPPLAGPSAILSTKPDPIPETLTQALGCPSSDATVENICQQAQTRGGNYNMVSALAQEA